MKWPGSKPKEAPPAPPVPSPEPDGLYWETKVADALGISRDRVREVRQKHLEEGKDFRLVRKEVVLSEQGLARLNDLLAAQVSTAPTATDPVTGQIPVTPGPPAHSEFKVRRVLPNRHLLACFTTDGGEKTPTLVRVKDNALFMPGMTLKAIQVENGLWQYRGRLPRKRGKW